MDGVYNLKGLALLKALIYLFSSYVSAFFFLGRGNTSQFVCPLPECLEWMDWFGRYSGRSGVIILILPPGTTPTDKPRINSYSPEVRTINVEL